MAQYITWGISVAAILVSLYVFIAKQNSSKQKDSANNDTSIKVSLGKQDTKLDMLLSSVGELRLDIKQQDAKIENLSEKIIKVEQSAKSAHRRIDELTEKEHPPDSKS